MKYSATEKEALAVLKAIEHFREYIHGSKFTVITDAAALTHIKTMRVEGQRRLSRWALALAEHDMEIKHRSGRLSVAPDALSRVWAIDTTSPTEDQWYIGIVEKVMKGDEGVKDFKLENGELFRYCIGMDDAGVPTYRLHRPDRRYTSDGEQDQ